MTTWKIDPGHSEIQFKIRHLAITNVVGKFRAFQGVVTAAADGFAGAGSTVEGAVGAGSGGKGFAGMAAGALGNLVGAGDGFAGTGAASAGEGAVGTGSVGQDFAGATVEASIEAASIDTNNPQRDGHLKSADFLDAEKYPALSFSGQLEQDADGFVLVGQLTIKNASQPIRWKVEHTGVATGRFGDVRAGFEISAKINRKDFGLSWNILADGGGLVLGEEVALQLDVQVVKQVAS